jgi:hypothetical protein
MGGGAAKGREGREWAGGEVDGRGHESAGQNPRMRSKMRHSTHLRRREGKRMSGGAAKEREGHEWAGWEVEGGGHESADRNPPIRS